METAFRLSKTIPLNRWGGGMFILGNLLFIVNKLDEMSRLFLSRSMKDVISGENLLLIVIGQAALLAGYLIFLQVYTPRVEKFAKRMLQLFCGGGILVAAGHISFMTALADVLPAGLQSFVEALFALVLAGMAVMLPGLILFGVANLRRPVLARWQWLPLATGLMGAIGFFLFSGEEMTATFLFFRTLFALGLVGLGMILWQEPPQR